MPSTLSIAEYWELGNPDNPDRGLHCDVGEPACWACGVYVIGDGEGTEEAYASVSEWLERAHLIAHAAGGSEQVSNLVLLCHMCHKDMDRELGLNTDRELALDWVRGYRNRFAAQVRSELDRLGADFAWYEEAALQNDDVWRYFGDQLRDRFPDHARRSPTAYARASVEALEVTKKRFATA